MVFKKAKQNRIFQDIVEQVEEAVFRRELMPGEKLPPEREMCDIFNTSRGTLREALRILEQKKLITIKLGSGGGAIVREPNSELIAENLTFLLQGQQGSLEQFTAMTAEVFAVLASSAAEKAGPSDVVALKQLVVRITDAMEETGGIGNVRITMDRLLLCEFSRIVDNPFYLFFLQATLETLHRNNLFSGMEGDVTRHYQEIRMIVFAVANNDHASAVQLMRKHILTLVHSPSLHAG